MACQQWTLTLLKVLGGSVDELESNELEATLLEAADDVTDESTLDTVGLFEAVSTSRLCACVPTLTLTMM